MKICSNQRRYCTLYISSKFCLLSERPSYYVAKSAGAAEYTDCISAEG